MTILYHSTRGQAPELDLRGVTLTGLASDGGLYVPKSWPEFSPDQIAGMKDKSYVDVAFEVLKPFTDGVIPDNTLKDLLIRAYASFNDLKVVPMRQIDERLWILELFHGPTLAFKDVAMQLLGHMFEYFLAQNNDRMTVVGATSGDAGMCGDYDSVIGMKKELSIWRFTRKIPGERMTPAEGEATICGVFIETDDGTGLAQSIEAFRLSGRLKPRNIG